MVLQGLWRIITVLVVVLGLQPLLASPLWADPVEVRAAAHGEYGRIVFKWAIPVRYQAAINNRVLHITFGQPIETSYSDITARLGKYVSGVRADSDGKGVQISLKGDYQQRSFYSGTNLVVDILDVTPQVSAPEQKPSPTVADEAKKPSPPSGAEPVKASKPDSGPGPLVGVRKGEHSNYTRVVVDWTSKVPYQVEQGANEARVTFEAPARLDLTKAGTKPDKFVQGLSAARNGTNAVLSIFVDKNADVRHFYAGTKVVIDVRAGSSDQAKAREVLPPIGESKASPPPVVAEKPAPQPVAKPAAEEEPVHKSEHVAEAKPQEGAAEPKIHKSGTAAQPFEPKIYRKAPPKPTGEADAPEAKAVPMATVSAEKVSAPTATSSAPAGRAGMVSGKGGTAEDFSLRFDWSEPVAAAAFRRGNAVWIAFDQENPMDAETLVKSTAGGVFSVEKMDIPRASVYRLVTVNNFAPRLRREGLAWIFDFKAGESHAGNVIELKSQPHSPAGARLFFSVSEAGYAIPVRDPDVGDNLVIVPVIPLDHGVDQRRGYPDLEVLPTYQGVAIRPISDGLRVRSLGQGVEVASSNSLKLSDLGAQLEASTKLGNLQPVRKVLDFDKWTHGESKDYVKSLQELELAAATSKGARRNIERLKLAQFYLTNGFGAETLGVLAAIERDDPTQKDNAMYNIMHGVSNFMFGRFDEAELDFANDSLTEYEEGEFWRAITQVAMGELVEPAATLKRTAAVIRAYPARLKLDLGVLLTDSALAVGDVRQAESYIEVLESENPDERYKGQLVYLRGKLKEQNGEFDEAISKYEEAMASNHRPSRAHAARARAELLFKQGQITIDDLIEAFEKLRFAWRGDDFEFSLLRRLGQIYMDKGDYRNGLQTLKQAATYFRKHEAVGEVTQKMIETFEKLYLDGEADKLTPLTAIALYDEFRELTPSGEKGDEMIRRLADRLASVDLLDRAAALLENQVNFRLNGLKKAQVATRLAVVYLTDNKPTDAIKALDKSQVPGMDAELTQQRRLLRARALIDQQNPAAALELIADDESLGAEELRYDVYWAAKDWPNAAKALRKLAVGNGAKRRKPLTDSQAHLIFNLSVALALNGNERALGALREDYGAAMEQSVYKDAFNLIASRNAIGILDYRTLSQKLSIVENFRGFMAAYRERLKAGQLSAIN